LNYFTMAAQTTAATTPLFLAFLFCLVAGKSNAFIAPNMHNNIGRLQQQQQSMQQLLAAANTDTTTSNNDRRSFLVGGVLSAITTALLVPTLPAAFAEQELETRQGIKVTAFNGLAFDYRGGDFNGLDSATLGEGVPSVSYAEFNERMKAGQVEFVEFLAPDGDVAYVTFKSSTSTSTSASTETAGSTSTSTTTPIRIGEGYPIEQHDGYSSPAFCVRAVKNAGVPYKFTVPALANFQKR
jgi:hypothetical protein